MEENTRKEELEEVLNTGKKLNELSSDIMKRVGNSLSELDAREHKWRRLEEKMEDNANRAKNKVILDVGGKRYVTSKATLLMHYDSYFYALLTSGKFEPEEDGSYFIDRNPKLFAIILEYLRTGKLYVKHLDSEQLIALKEELDYYQIPALGEVSQDDKTMIENWAGKKFGNLLWRATEHGFGADQFHARCDNKGPTVTIITSSQGWIFGGYANDPWNSKGGYFGSKNSFIFTITNPHNIPPTKYNNNIGDYFLVGNEKSGPIFGINDIYVCDLSNISNESYTFFPGSYTDTTSRANKTFTGSFNFSTKEIEVYEMVEM